MSLIIGSTQNAVLPSELVKNSAFVKYVDSQDASSGQVGARVKADTDSDNRVLRDAAQSIRDRRFTDFGRRTGVSASYDTVTISEQARKKNAPRIISQALENHLKVGRSQEVDPADRVFVDAYLKSVMAQRSSAQNAVSPKDVDQIAKQTALDYLHQWRLEQQ